MRQLNQRGWSVFGWPSLALRTLVGFIIPVADFSINALAVPPNDGNQTGFNQTTVAIAATDGDSAAFVFDDTAGMTCDAVVLGGESWVWKARVRIPTGTHNLFCLYSTSGDNRSYIFRSLNNRLILLTSPDGVALDSALNETFAVDTVTDLEVRYDAGTDELTALVDGVVTRTEARADGYAISTPVGISTEIGGLGTNFIVGKIFSMSLRIVPDFAIFTDGELVYVGGEPATSA